jgi:hypothetical protein
MKQIRIWEIVTGIGLVYDTFNIQAFTAKEAIETFEKIYAASIKENPEEFIISKIELQSYNLSELGDD